MTRCTGATVGLIDGIWSALGWLAPTRSTRSRTCSSSGRRPVATSVEVIATEINEDGHVETQQLDADYALVISGISLGCDADVDGNGEVDFDDLLLLLNAWGPCEGCPEDIDGDDQVTFDDLLILLSLWGPC